MNRRKLRGASIGGGLLLPAPFGDPGLAEDELKHPQGAEGGGSCWELHLRECYEKSAMYRFSMSFFSIF